MIVVEYPTREPDRPTAPGLQDILLELVRREPIFHRPELGTTREDFERSTAPDFWETGASGQRYSREYVWATIEQRQLATPQDPPQRDPWKTSDFQLREIAPNTYLLTYTLQQPDRLTRRLTIWQRTNSNWTILYHQGTVVTE
ncbi:DUF4440 domain-containing protein [Nocardia coubleae]|uniref:DUF4440 domain-containing protein n=1 Tax=Nocardia coubleae TaxID=356147 RepID=A0A846W711_9NOCA|nr:DUF4440 domain-containing protein [Nocardia coubleae]NKX88484.1 DUF4440 domain-containing protein [Nocardia coubleae]